MLRVLVVGPEGLSDALGPTVLGRPDVDRFHARTAEEALESRRELTLGTKVGLTLELPGQAPPAAVVGQVVRLAGEEGGLFRVGVEFLVYRGDARERIPAFVEAEPRPVDRPGAPAAALPAHDCILTADHEGRVIEFNAAARRLFGYTRSEILGREVADTIVPPALRDELRRRLRGFVRTGGNPDLGRRREATLMRADGSLVPVEVVVIPADVKRRVILTAYIRDVSERRRGARAWPPPASAPPTPSPPR